ncbi:MAG: hypothetical protein GKR90_27055 [Pseudomonadales bacterium]|nr:hypothetical protein [Pseudomonadales bacterium]
MPNKKTRLARRAKKAHDRAVKQGKTQVGTRRVLNYSNPRDLGGGTSTVPVYKREKKILEKIDRINNKPPKPPKKPKQNVIGRIKNALKVKKGGIGKNKKSKAEKAACSFENKRGRQRNRRRHSSCK